MQSSMVPLLVLLVAFAPANAEAMSPIEKVIAMISDNEAKVIGEGEAAQKTYSEFSELCEERSKEMEFEIKTAKADVEHLQATIDKAVADQEAFTAKIEELSEAIATAEADLKAATEIREKEAADFVTEEKESTTTINELTVAIRVEEQQM